MVGIYGNHDCIMVSWAQGVFFLTGTDGAWVLTKVNGTSADQT